MSKQTPLATPTLQQLTGFLTSTIFLFTWVVQTCPQATHPVPPAPSSSFMLLPECTPACWNFPVECFLKAFSTFWQLLEWQSWGRGKLPYWGPGNWCWNQQALRSPVLSEEWLSVWIHLPALLPGGRLTGSKLNISLTVEQRGEVCIVPPSATPQ